MEIKKSIETFYKHQKSVKDFTEKTSAVFKEIDSLDRQEKALSARIDDGIVKVGQCLKGNDQFRADLIVKTNTELNLQLQETASKKSEAIKGIETLLSQLAKQETAYNAFAEQFRQELSEVAKLADESRELSENLSELKIKIKNILKG